MIHAFAMLFAWTGARQGRVVVGGPRFALHPAVVQLDAIHGTGRSQRFVSGPCPHVCNQLGTRIEARSPRVVVGDLGNAHEFDAVDL